MKFDENDLYSLGRDILLLLKPLTDVHYLISLINLWHPVSKNWWRQSSIAIQNQKRKQNYLIIIHKVSEAGYHRASHD